MNYIISHNDEDMFIFVPFWNKQFYTDYNKGLYDIFNSGVFISASYGGRKKDNYLKFSFTPKQEMVYFSHIVYCYYHRGLNSENYEDVIRNFQEELKNRNLQVDHLIEDRLNNTKSNLSLISVNDNRTKRSMKTHIKKRFDYIESFDGNGYRVSFSYVSGFASSRVRTEYLYCNSITELKKLREFLKANKGLNQWKIKNHRIGVLNNGVMYSIRGIYSLWRPLPELASSYDVHIMQRYLNGLPRDKFVDSNSLIETI